MSVSVSLSALCRILEVIIFVTLKKLVFLVAGHCVKLVMNVIK